MVKIILCWLLIFPVMGRAWGNGQAGNAQTDKPSECGSPPYSTHDWVADMAMQLLPLHERLWFQKHRAMLLLGTEAPDNSRIPVECEAPNTGYDDRRKGHSVEWSGTRMVKDRAAVRAREEYQKAVKAIREGRDSDAAFHLGAAGHYIGDSGQYCHAIPFEKKRHHSGYETWATRRTPGPGGVFASYVIRRESEHARKLQSPYMAVKRISWAVVAGEGRIRSARWMEDHFANKDQDYIDSAGESLAMTVSTLANVFHTFAESELAGR